MKTVFEVDGDKCLINGQPTYAGRQYNNRSVEGLLFNSRMIQAIFDDECPTTRPYWVYPDTGIWEPDRNTNEFCAHLPEYRAHGLLAVTVGLQGGGSIYSPEVYENYINTAFTPDGTLKPAYFERLRRVLAAADATGMVVIVNYFYGQQVRKYFLDDSILVHITEKVTEWLLGTGYRNIAVDVANEVGEWWNRELFHPNNIHRLIEVVQQTTLNGHRLLASASGISGDFIGDEYAPVEQWLSAEDISLPHGNGCTPEQIHEKIRRMREAPAYRKRPRPIIINEDSITIENMEAAFEEGCSWGFYSQGYGSDYRGDHRKWYEQPREETFEQFSGFQTVPVNWGINTPDKKSFFDKVAEITGSQQ